MKAELRALERKFVKERATVMAREFIAKLAYRWPKVLQGERTEFTVLDLVIELWDGDIPLPAIGRTINSATSRAASAKEKTQTRTPSSPT